MGEEGEVDVGGRGPRVGRWVGGRQAVIEEHRSALVADDQAERTNFGGTAEELKVHRRAERSSHLTYGAPSGREGIFNDALVRGA